MCTPVPPFRYPRLVCPGPVLPVEPVPWQGGLLPGELEEPLFPEPLGQAPRPGLGLAGGDLELDLSGDTPAIRNPKKIWTQTPKTSGRGHYSHRIAFGP